MLFLMQPAESEVARLRDVLDGMTEAVCRFRPDGTILYVNATYCQLTGRSAQELVGTVYVPIVHPDDVERVTSEVASMSPERPDIVIENRIILPTGEARWTQWTNRGFFDERGTLIECQAVGRDIHARVHTEKALRRSHAEFRFLAEASESLTTNLDYESTFQRVAQLAVPFLADCCLATAMDKGNLFDRVAIAHVDPEIESALQARQVKHLVGEPPGSMCVFADELMKGQPILVPELAERDLEAMGFARLAHAQSLMIVPLSSQSRLLGALAFVSSSQHSCRHYGDQELSLAVELGRRAGMALDNARLYAELREVDSRKDQFLATLGHELRNPLAAIVSALDALESAADPAAARRALEVARRQARHQTRLVEDLVDASRLINGQITLKPEMVELGAMLTTIAEAHRPAFTERHQSLNVELPPVPALVPAPVSVPVSMPIYVRADPTRLEQIISNLLDNACKYTPERGTAAMSVTRQGDRARISIRDTGNGLSPELLSLIFEPFVQVGSRHLRPSGGLGLGLTVVRKLVEMHGGCVVAHSEGLGCGSEFIVELPAAEMPQAVPASPASARTRAAPGGRRILVVDDNADAADMLGDLLRAWGYDVYVAYRGEEAVNVAAEIRPELAFIDIGMPGMDGYDTARALRRLPGCEWAKLIALTGYAQPSDVAAAAAAGFDHHVAKPMDVSHLRELLTG